MKKVVLLVMLIVFAVCFAGCAKKDTETSDSLEAVSMETLTATVNTTQTLRRAQSSVLPPGQPAQRGVAQAIKEPPLPPQGPYKPTAREIQAALKNAGYYRGNVDGKVGPLTKKAIQEFQESNGLQADGKVGAKTWALLGKYANKSTEQKISQ